MAKCSAFQRKCKFNHASPFIKKLGFCENSVSRKSVSVLTLLNFSFLKLQFFSIFNFNFLNNMNTVIIWKSVPAWMKASFKWALLFTADKFYEHTA